ncbi:MAG: NYN domain-containing protein [Cyanobacteria bacterium CRU_2_1]|nr:NYN domain-containing protein [Cyanobacteria bacterium RU_5_0]NJR63013.1 NYN domain-containing protein [Cyanobacteria bacterium CRU_2_1]
MGNFPREARLAVLIDAENVNIQSARLVLARLRPYKLLALKRAYGDWSNARLSGWKPALAEMGIQPIHAPTYTAGKNSADITLVIDAMDLLHTQKVELFCIVSSDGDFTPLVYRLVESGAKVVGFGQKKSPKAFVNACHRFLYFEDLERSITPLPSPHFQTTSAYVVDTQALQSEAIAMVQPANTHHPAKAKPMPSREELLKLLKDTYQALSPQSNWVSLSRFSSQLQKQHPGFTSKHFGYARLRKMIESVNLFDLRQRSLSPENPTSTVIEIRLKPAV